MRIGPYVMPEFSQHAISNRQLDSIVRYVEYTKEPTKPGGWGIGFLGPVPEAEDVADPTGTRVVEHGRVLGQAQRVVEGDEQGGDGDADAPRARCEGGGQQQRRREVAIVDTVVFGQHQGVEPLLVAVGRLVEGGGIELGAGRRRERRAAQVVARDEQGHGRWTLLPA